MPIYRFQLESPLPEAAVVSLIQSMVRRPPPWWPPWKDSFDRAKGTAPFIGRVEGNVFKVRPDIRGQNSFQPMIWGRVAAGPIGSRIVVTMFVHPVVLAFMAFWLSMIGFGALHAGGFGAAMMLVFGIALVLGGFFPEAIKARRLLQEALQAGAFNQKAW